MNRLVSYSESSEEEDKGLISPQKCNSSEVSTDFMYSKNEVRKDWHAKQIIENKTCRHDVGLHVNDTSKHLLNNLDFENGSKLDILNPPEIYSTTSFCCDSENSIKMASSGDFFNASTVLGSNNVLNLNDTYKPPIKCVVDKEDKIMEDLPILHTESSSQTKVSDIVPRSVPVNISESAMGSRKRKHSEEIKSQSNLQVPDSLKSMFHGSCHKWIDNASEHDNRIRSFPHLEGNWAAHVYFPVPKNEILEAFFQSVIQIFEPLEFKTLPEYHISLSRTVAIRHHWIEPIVTSLREQMKLLKSSLSEMTALKLFTNDEKTRTFICIELSQDDTEFVQYVKAVDTCFLEFKLPVYYKNPSFHISIGWCLGNVIPEVSEDKLLIAKEMLSNFIAENPELSVVLLQQVCCRAGNKLFAITLEEEFN
ncbi:U6 snRNA phosphodiesterase [Biomphalaria glabrata]|nr:U6 snRNA phosphodiesterase [Biomphalaria glabrata]